MDLNGVLRESKKLKPIMDLKNYIANKIDNNGDIKRYCKYLTYEPLEFTSLNYSGNPVSQPDIEESLLEDIKDLNKDINIIPYTLNQNDEVLAQKVFIFIHNYKNDFRDTIGDTTIMVDITCPKLYNKLPFGEERIYKIAELIMDELDSVYVDEFHVDSIGAYRFKIDGIGNEWIFNGKDILAYSFPIKVSTINSR